MTTLQDAAPAEFMGGEYSNAAAYVFRDVEVVETVRDRAWPGRERHVSVWWILRNGKIVGWNESPTRGWSFPVASQRLIQRTTATPVKASLQQRLPQLLHVDTRDGSVVLGFGAAEKLMLPDEAVRLAIRLIEAARACDRLQAHRMARRQTACGEANSASSKTRHDDQQDGDPIDGE